MIERPILMSGPMVRALLAGTKTQTRRAVRFSGTDLDTFLALPKKEACCPYGLPGDRLWVRENGWERPARTPKMMHEGADTWAPYYYDADGITPAEAADFKAWGFKRRPSIHMPRSACRIVLEVTGVRIEQLREISEADCRAEGCPGGHGAIPGYAYNATPHEHYSAVWEALNGADSWQTNPWVWVVEFRRA